MIAALVWSSIAVGALWTLTVLLVLGAWIDHRDATRSHPTREKETPGHEGRGHHTMKEDPTP